MWGYTLIAYTYKVQTVIPALYVAVWFHTGSIRI